MVPGSYVCHKLGSQLGGKWGYGGGAGGSNKAFLTPSRMEGGWGEEQGFFDPLPYGGGVGGGAIQS